MFPLALELTVEATFPCDQVRDVRVVIGVMIVRVVTVLRIVRVVIVRGVSSGSGAHCRGHLPF